MTVQKPRCAFAAALAAVVALTIVTLGGCGGGSGGGDGEDPSGPVVITLWEQMDPQERDMQKLHIEAFEAAHPGWTMEVSHYGTEQLRTQYQTAALAGSGPDLVYGPSDQVGPFSVMGLIHPIEEILDDETLAQFIPEAFDTLSGHIYALPDQVGNHLTLVRNTELVPDPPQTMDELIAKAKELTVDEDGDGRPDRYGLVFEVMEPFWTVPLLTAYGGWVMDAESAPILDTQAMVKALQLLRDLKVTHAVMPTECDYELADTMFKEGRAAMIVNGPWSWDAYRKAGLQIALCRIPKVTETGLWPAPMISSKGYSVNKRLKGKALENALTALEYLTSVEFQTDYSTKLGTLPTRKAAYEKPVIRDDEFLKSSFAQVEVGRRMPVVPEMRAIWDVMRPAVQSVWNGTLEPEEAAEQMQEKAVEKIAEMKR